MLHLCGFLKKHGRDSDLADMRHEYCTGDKQDECKRKAYMIEHGKVPPDDMTPTGEVVELVEAT
jgi:hypothetical protein